MAKRGPKPGVTNFTLPTSVAINFTWPELKRLQKRIAQIIWFVESGSIPRGNVEQFVVMRIEMAKLLEKLTDQEQQALLLCYGHGFSHPLAAKEMGVCERTLAKKLDNARIKLLEH